MTDFHRRGVEPEGRRGSRIDLQKGGCYLGLPQNPGHAVHEPVTINPVSTKSGAVHIRFPHFRASIKENHFHHSHRLYSFFF
jgi:hypothetical protein